MLARAAPMLLQSAKCSPRAYAGRSAAAARFLRCREAMSVKAPRKFESSHSIRLFATDAKAAADKTKGKSSDRKTPAGGGGDGNKPAGGSRGRRETPAERIAREKAEDAVEAPAREAAHAKMYEEELAEERSEEIGEGSVDLSGEGTVGKERLAVVKRDLAAEEAMIPSVMAQLTDAQKRRWSAAKELAYLRKGVPLDPEVQTSFMDAYANYLASPLVETEHLDEIAEQEATDMLDEMDRLPKDPARLIIDSQTDMRQGRFFRIYDEELDYIMPEGFMGKQLDEQTKILQNWSLLIRPATIAAGQRLQAQRDAKFKTAADRRGTVLLGEPGVGKSAILTQIIYWARRTGWLVCAIDAEKFVSEGNLQRSRLEPLCFDQPEVAVEFLRCQSVAHADKLSVIPLKTAFSIEGFKRTAKSTLFDLVKFGGDEANERYASDALYYFRRELNLVTEFPVLIAIDSINSMYTPSQGFGDPDDRSGRPQLISPEKLTATRCFRDFREHGLLYGTTICATSETMPSTTKHLKKAIPRLPNPIKVPEYDMNEFLSTMRFYRENILFGPVTRGTKNYIYYLCSGRGHEVWKYSLLL